MDHLEMGGDIMGYQNYVGYEREKNRGLSPSNNNNNNNNYNGSFIYIALFPHVPDSPLQKIYMRVTQRLQCGKTCLIKIK